MIKSVPKPHQIEGAKFVVNKKVCIVGAKTGMGKTLVILACVHYHVYGKQDYAVVFAPVKAYDKVWEQETVKHTDMKVIRMPKAFEVWQKTGSLNFLLDYDIVLVKYSDIKAEFFEFLGLITPGRVTVYDEAHKLKTPDTKVVRLLASLTREVKTKWAITATMIGNDVLDLWGLMNFLDPMALGTERQFKAQYCVMEEKVIGMKKMFGRMVPDTRMEVVDYKNLDKLKSIMSNYLWTKESMVKVSFKDIHYNLTEQEDVSYLEAAKGLMGRADKDSMKGFAQRLPDLQRVVDGAFDKWGDVTVGYRCSKYDVYLKDIQSRLVKNESVILFAEFTATFDMLYKLLKEDLPNVPIYRVNGSVVEYDETTVKTPCIVLSSMAGSESLNLKFANHVYCYSVPFSVLGFIQLVGRITRLDSEYLDDLNVYLPRCDLNIDAYKYEYLMSNADLINTVLGKDANLPVKQLEDQRKESLSDMRKRLLWRVKEVKARSKK